MVNDILKILADYGLFGVGLIIAILFIFKYGSAKIEMWAKHEDNDENIPEFHPEISTNNETELKYHTFFSNALYKIELEIPHLPCNPGKPVRQMMCRDLLTIYTQSIYDKMFNLVERDMKEWSPEKWTNELSVAVMEIGIDSSLKARKDFETIVIDGFMKWNAPTMKIILDYIVDIGSSSVYASNIARMNTLLFVMNVVLITTLGDAERTLRDLNGELSGLKYKNLLIE